MYYQLGRVTGRLVASTHLQTPLFPIAPVALQRLEPPSIQYNTTHFSTVTQDACATGKRRLIPGTNMPFPPLDENIRKKQELFQVTLHLTYFLY
ncbi:hypothetical protein O3G_MSEX007964 [Manduca sexta]|uniref:Uncharacterized protein n=1 Tax=Manduca sexta TaxID=7130 RepID=A0A922CP57_MANSE|nr:hypothetical protein O3G_MSEX007964 [Manduca sexta]